MTMLTQDVKKVIQPIKAQGAPLEEYFKICQDIGSEPYKMQLLAQALSKDGYEMSPMWKIRTH